LPCSCEKIQGRPRSSPETPPDCPCPRVPPVSLQPQSDFAIPEETQRVAHAAFPKGNLCLRIADELVPLYRDEQFADVVPTRGHPADSPARLAMASVLQ